jgi:hypothetical protein
MSRADLVEYGRFCAWALARAHARSGDAARISGYLGKSDRFDGAVADFALAYMKQNEADYAAFQKAVRAGHLHAEVEPGAGRRPQRGQVTGSAGRSG